jgi:hypothetical protein
MLAEQSGLPLPGGALAFGGQGHGRQLTYKPPRGNFLGNQRLTGDGHILVLRGTPEQSPALPAFPGWRFIWDVVARKAHASLIIRGFQMLTTSEFLPIGRCKRNS